MHIRIADILKMTTFETYNRKIITFILKSITGVTKIKTVLGNGFLGYFIKDTGYHFP